MQDLDSTSDSFLPSRVGQDMIKYLFPFPFGDTIYKCVAGHVLASPSSALHLHLFCFSTHPFLFYQLDRHSLLSNPLFSALVLLFEGLLFALHHTCLVLI